MEKRNWEHCPLWQWECCGGFCGHGRRGENACTCWSCSCPHYPQYLNDVMMMRVAVQNCPETVCFCAAVPLIQSAEKEEQSLERIYSKLFSQNSLVNKNAGKVFRDQMEAMQVDMARPFLLTSINSLNSSQEALS